MMKVSRRDVMLGGAIAGAGLAFGGGRHALAKGRLALPIPPEIRADADGIIRLTSQKGTRRFVEAGLTETFGVNGNFLAPTVRVNRGDQVAMQVANALGEDTTMHWHGLKIPGRQDGGPHSIIQPDDTWTARLSIDQPAATCYYHPHFFPTTGEQVLKGVAGLFLIDDDESGALALPSRWGVDDIPIILQDRRFTADGNFFYRMNMVAVTTGYIGDTMLINGANYPLATTARGWLRLRLLNGSNARTYRIKASDDRKLYVVGSDGGLLAEPVEVNELPIYSGERYEVMVDARDGRAFDLVTLPVNQLGMNLPPFDEALPLLTLSPDGADTSTALPDSLVQLPPLDPDLPPASQELVMGMGRDDEGMGLFKQAGLMDMNMSGTTDPAVVEQVVKLIVEEPALAFAEQVSANTINAQSFQMNLTPFEVPIHRNLRWVVSEGTDGMLHPVHIHGCQFRIVSIDGVAPPAYMTGWKDTVPISNGGRAELQIRFDHPAAQDAPFMAHCHNLEHEDSGMMAQFTVG